MLTVVYDSCYISKASLHDPAPEAFFFLSHNEYFMTQIHISVSGSGHHATQFRAKARGNTFLANDPSVLFDERAGISPMEYLLGGYAAYINLVFYSLAHQAGIAVHSLHLKVEGVSFAEYADATDDVLPALTAFKQLTILVDLHTNATLPAEFALIRKVAAASIIRDKQGNVPEVGYRFARFDQVN